MHPYIHFFGHDIGTYGICMTLGYVLVFLLCLRKGKSYAITSEDLFIVSGFVLGGALLGGSLVYVFVTYSFKEIVRSVLNLDFSFIGSGTVFYGGLIGGVVSALCGISVAKCKLGPMERIIVPYIPLGHAIGRIGCVMAGCCHGFAYDGPMALYYPNAISGLSPTQGYFPVQLLEALANIGICFFLLWFEKRIKRKTDLLFAYLGIYAILRFFLEMLRGDSVRGIWNDFSTSQIISVVLMIISVIGALWKRQAKSTEVGYP